MEGFYTSVDFTKPEHYVIPAVCALGGVYILKRIYRNYSLPPGPARLPIVGNLLSVSQEKLHLQFHRIVEKYGPICSVQLGQSETILISDYDILKEMFSQPVYSARPTNPQLSQITKDCGVVATSGQSWITQRRFALHVLRDFGFAKTLSADMITAEAVRLEKCFDQFSGESKGAHVVDVFTESTNNVIAGITYAKYPGQPDDGFLEVTRAFKEFTSNGAFLTPIFCFPLLAKLGWIMNRIPVVKRIINNQETMNRYALKKIKERREVMKTNQTPDCLCDAYILEQEKAEKQGDFETFKDFQIMRVSVELFAAGTDTTARSLEWLMVYMSVYEDVQYKVHKEIVEVLGMEGRVQMSDKMHLSYTLAVMDETYRKVSLAAIGVPHRALEDSYFHGYFIPKNSTIIPLLYSLNHNPKYYSDPQKYNPERFLDDEGHYKPNPYLIHFSIGKRTCLGESLARMELFLLFVSLMQKFKVELHEDCAHRKDEILVGKLGIILGCYDYKLKIQRR